MKTHDSDSAHRDPTQPASHWRNYGGPAQLTVVADLHSSAAPIQISALIVPTELTLEQSAELRQLLERAEADVRRRRIAAVATAADAGCSCDECRQEIHAGELIHWFDDGAVHERCLAGDDCDG